LFNFRGESQGKGRVRKKGKRASDERDYTDKKEKKIFLIYKEIQIGAVAKLYLRKGFIIYEEMRNYFPIHEEAVSHK
jgi:hypothetical protein